MRSEWEIVWRLVLTFGLSAAIGLERELRQKSAGLRTHTLVGLGSALFTIAGAYGFADVIDPQHVVLDPSRVAAQVASGIGFIGGGLIFVRRDAVRGLTTAAGVWVTAAIGLAAGAGLPVLATVTTAGYFVVAFAFPAVASRLPRSRFAPASLQVTYVDGRGVLRDALSRCTGAGFSVVDIATRRLTGGEGDELPTVAVRLDLQGAGSVAALTSDLQELDGVLAVSADPRRRLLRGAYPRRVLRLILIALVVAAGFVLWPRAEAGNAPAPRERAAQATPSPAATPRPRRRAPLPRPPCRDDVPGCASTSGRIVYVERVDPDGDGDLHVIVTDRRSVSLPGLTAVDVSKDLRPRRDPRVGDRASAMGPVQTGHFGQSQIHALEFHVRRR